VSNLKTLEEVCKNGSCDSNFITNLKIHSSHGDDCKVKKVLNHYYEYHHSSSESGNTQQNGYGADISNSANNDTSYNGNTQYGSIEEAKEKYYNFDDDYEVEEIKWFEEWSSSYSSSGESSYSVKSYSSNSYSSNSCKLPLDEDIVPVTPRYSNKGFAMSPDENCTPGKFCPYACRPGMYSAQWSPHSTCHTGPQCGSHLGGGYCNANGTLTKPFPERPWCEPGVGNVGLLNRLKQPVSACQTVYPGNEAMLIPTVVHPSGSKTMNVPPSKYWFGTSAHYYLNPAPSTRKECRWGNHGNPIGNWSPYVLGMGQASDGLTYISLNWNPEFTKDKPHVGGLKDEYSTKSYHMRRSTDKYSQNDSYRNDYELYKVKVECEEGGECLGLPCSIDPSQGVQSGGCTVTLKKGSRANFVVY
jgi:hypothetical protein